MRLLSVALQSVLVFFIVIYTVNFGRWMLSRHNKTGAYSAFGVAAVALGMAAWTMYLHYE